MKRLLIALSLTLVMAVPAMAHFQMVYTPEIALDKGADLDMKLGFYPSF